MLGQQRGDAADRREVHGAVFNAGVDDGLVALALADARCDAGLHKLGRGEVHAACRGGAHAAKRAAGSGGGGAGVEQRLPGQRERQLAGLLERFERTGVAGVSHGVAGAGQAHFLASFQVRQLGLVQR